MSFGCYCIPYDSWKLKLDRAESALNAALARVAELEAQLAKQAPVIEAARAWRDAVDAARAVERHAFSGIPLREGKLAESSALMRADGVRAKHDALESAIRTLDKETP